MSFDIFNPSSNKTIRCGDKSIKIDSIDKVLSSNLIIPKKNVNWYTKFNRFGCIDPVTTNSEHREYLFFTKPDLNIFNGSAYSELTLNPSLKNYPIFVDAFKRYKNVLVQLEGSVSDSTNSKNPFMCILSNAVTSNLDLPSLSAESADSSSNIYGTNIQYRSHSLKSDNGYDFSLSFTDTTYLEIYHLVKLYDEFIRLMKLGAVAPKKSHIVNRILPDQFSIYKIITATDGETILFAAKITGVYFADVPRSDFGDMPQDGIKYSLSFHGQFPEDTTPTILTDFNRVTPGSTKSFVNTYSDGRVNNDWVSYPVIIASESSKRSSLNLGFNYKLKWTNKRK